MLIASVGANSLVATPEWFDHAVWAGVHPLDVIFPVFVTLSGCGLAFAMRNRVEPRPLIRRFIVLIVVGLLYNMLVTLSFGPATVRFTGVLQLYAGLVVLISLLHLVTRTWWGWAIITAALAIGQTTLLGLYAQTCTAHLLTRVCNPSGLIDTAIFGANHIYQFGAAGHDPEGLVALFGALVSASAGATLGHVLLASRRRPCASIVGPRAAVAPLLGLAAGFLVLTVLVSLVIPLLLGVDVPAMKRLWTAPFALPIAVAVALLLLLGHLLLDRENVPILIRRSSYPLLSLGRNSLLVYFGSHVLTSFLNRPFAGGPPLSVRVSQRLDWFVSGQFAWTIISLAFWIGLAMLLNHRNIYLRP
jgi:predicted acyltransferase